MRAAPSAGQQPFAFAFSPPVASRVHLVYETEGEMLFVGLPELPDTMLGQTATFASVTRRIVERLEGAVIARVTYDSSRARYRLREGASWIDLDVPQAVGPVRVLLDDRMRSSPLDGGVDAGELAAARGVVQAVQISLPGGEVLPGGQWTATASFPLTTELPGAVPVTVTTTLRGRAVATLDSVVVREMDTLAYVTAHGPLDAVLLDATYRFAGEDATVEVWGSFVTTVLWSTGWQGWAGGAATVQIQQRIEAPRATGLPDGRVTATINSRFRIRP